MRPLGIDPERDRRIAALAASTIRRCDAAATFILRLVFWLLFLAGGSWAMFAYFEPCAGATTLCAMPLLYGRARYSSSSPGAMSRQPNTRLLRCRVPQSAAMAGVRIECCA